MAFTKIAAAGIGSTETVTLHSLEVINNATVGGVLTYEDVTNVDSVGLITARNGIVGGSGGTNGDGGSALANTITGSSVDYAGGGGSGNYTNGNDSVGGGAGAGNGGTGSGTAGDNASIANRGSGGGGAGGGGTGSGGDGSDGVIVLRFPSDYTATLTGGVTSTSATVGSETIITITATSDSSQTVTFN